MLQKYIAHITAHYKCLSPHGLGMFGNDLKNRMSEVLFQGVVRKVAANLKMQSEEQYYFLIKLITPPALTLIMVDGRTEIFSF